MSVFDWIQFFFLIALILCLIPVLGSYMAKVFQGEKTFLHRFLHPLEKLSYRLAKVPPSHEMGWKKYAQALLGFNLIGFLALLVIQLLQKILPLNPEHFEAPSVDLAINTAMSFVTNTNWQAYSGETSLSYGTQMWGLTVQNFLSAATGNAALLALIRGISRKTSETLGNFWVDLVRTVVYLLIPLALVLAIFLLSQGVVQTLSPYVTLTTLENQPQTIPLGPVASQVAIKQLGTNGGGFFAANSAHPFENPTPLSNFFELIAILLIPASTIYMYGIMSGAKKHAKLLLLGAFFIWIAGFAIALYSEHLNNPLFNAQPLLEGKETRIGVMSSILWSVTTTATSNGSVNAMLSSLTPLAGGVALFNIFLGEVAFGGVGVGLCSLMMFVFLTVFLSGLMVGKTPEYMGKKIEKKEMQWVSIAILVPAALILIGAGLATALSTEKNLGPHGLTEILYGFASSSANNGSAFLSLQADTPFYTILLSVCMLIGRLSIILPSLALGGLLAKKKAHLPSSGTFSTDTFLFLSLLVGVILFVNALTFFPALALGPIIEHFLMLRGVMFG